MWDCKWVFKSGICRKIWPYISIGHSAPPKIFWKYVPSEKSRHFNSKICTKESIYPPNMQQRSNTSGEFPLSHRSKMGFHTGWKQIYNFLIRHSVKSLIEDALLLIFRISERASIQDFQKNYVVKIQWNHFLARFYSRHIASVVLLTFGYPICILSAQNQKGQASFDWFQ